MEKTQKKSFSSNGGDKRALQINCPGLEVIKLDMAKVTQGLMLDLMLESAKGFMYPWFMPFTSPSDNVHCTWPRD